MITAALCLFLYGTPTCYETPAPTYEEQVVYAEQHYNPRPNPAPTYDTSSSDTYTRQPDGTITTGPTQAGERGGMLITQQHTSTHP